MKKSRIPDLLIEQLALGELPEGKARELERDPRVRARLEELAASDREILERYPPERMGRLIRQRLEKEEQLKGERPRGERRMRERSARRPFPRLVPAVAFATAAVVVGAAGVLLATVAPWRQGAGSEATRMKGAQPRLEIFLKTDSGPEELRAGGEVRAGDVLQIRYVAAARKYGVIFSIDGRGVLTLHFPSSAGASSLLAQQGETSLEYAYKLDDAPGFERFFLVTSNRAPAVQEVLAAGRRLAADPRQASKGQLELPSGMEQWSLLLAKR
jgi:anti-sigma factor RsiW